jgi:hypothetical protein
MVESILNPALISGQFHTLKDAGQLLLQTTTEIDANVKPRLLFCPLFASCPSLSVGFNASTYLSRQLVAF